MVNPFKQPGLSIALITLWLNILWLVVVNPLDAPDEPSHLMAVMQVRKDNMLPEVHFDFAADHAGRVVTTPDQDTVAYAISLGQSLPYKLLPVESSHPPFYYIVAGLTAHILSPEPQNVLYVSRVVTAVFAALTIYFIWAAVRELAPNDPMWAACVSGMVALLPQFSFNSASVNNDSAINMAAAASFFIWTKALRNPAYDRWMLRAGALMGLCILSKLNGLALLPGLGLVILFRTFQTSLVSFASPAVLSCQASKGRQLWRASLPRLKRGLSMVAGATLSCLLVCGWWLLRNYMVYGEPTGFRDAVRFYQGTFSPLDLTSQEAVARFVQATWYSFWGTFGWMNDIFPSDTYNQARLVTIVLTTLSLVAMLLAFGRRVIERLTRKRVTPHQFLPIYSWQALLAMLVVAGVLAYAYLQFSTHVAVQAQARYFFPVLLPLALVFTGGLYSLLRFRLPRIVAFGSLFAWLAYLNFTGLLIVQ